MKRTKRGTLKPHNSSLVINLDSILRIRNIQTPFTYLIRLGISSTSASKLLSGKAVQINLKQITSLCLNLNCTPNDIFSLRKMDLSPIHELNILNKIEEEDLTSIEEFLKGKSLKEIKEILKPTISQS